MSARETGQIQRWDADRGFGFIRPDADDEAPTVFCHTSAVHGGVVPVVGDRVEYHVTMQARGPRAEGVFLLEPSDAF